MKALFKFSVFNPNYLIILICFTIISGCNKDNILEDSSTLQNSTYHKNGGMQVSPSTANDVLVKAEEDWQNINDALQNAGPGDEVTLEEGIFYLHKSIVVYDFNGTLKGEGKYETTIKTAPRITFDVSEAPLKEWDNNWIADGNSMLCFPQNFNNEERTVNVTDLTIVVNEPCTPWERDKNGVWGPPTTHNNLAAIQTYYTGLDKDLTNPIELNVNYKDIAVKGVKNPKFYDAHFGTNYSVFSGITAAGASSGEIVVKDVFIENSIFAMSIHVFNGESATVLVTSSKINNARVGIYGEINNKLIITDNED